MPGTGVPAREAARFPGMGPSWRWVVLAVAMGAIGCAKHDDGSDPAPAEQLPPLVLRDDTSVELLTWIDERGGTHTTVAIADVPAASKNPVRVIVKDAGQGALFYVADLSAKQADGSYPVRSMPRSEWEGLIESRRAKVASHREKLAPPPVNPPAEPRGDTPRGDTGREPASGVHAIIYGASWCGPCHQAQDFLKRRGVAVTFYDIEREPARGVEMARKLHAAGRGGSGIPVIDLEGQLFIGFSPSALDQAITKAHGATPI